MEHFAKIVNGLKQLAFFTNASILDSWQGLEYAFEYDYEKTINFQKLCVMKKVCEKRTTKRVFKPLRIVLSTEN